jgi:hypothetical protein
VSTLFVEMFDKDWLSSDKLRYTEGRPSSVGHRRVLTVRRALSEYGSGILPESVR